MKILRVIHSAHPRSGGPINGVLQITPLLEAEGIDMSLVSLDAPDEEFWKSFPGEGCGVGPGKGFFGYTQQLDNWLRQHLGNFDMVVVHGIWQYHSFAAMRWCLRLKVPYIVYPHGMLDPWFKRTYPLKHLKKWCYWPWADYRTLRNAKAVCFTTAQERDLARESFWMYQANEYVVPYGTVPPEVEEEEIPGDSYLLYLGRIHPKKGLDLLLDAYERWSVAEKPRLIIAGPVEDDYSRKLRDASAKGVEWVGPVSGNRKWNMLRSAEALVLPSHQENFGMVVAESLSMGTPVLTTHAVNTGADVAEDGAGLVESDDAPGILRMLEKWGRMAAGERDVMRRNALASFSARYDLRLGAGRLANDFRRWAGG